mmetsp:Transcript_99887/g.196183  ORF Transcript_99887/g.196183 Transcript_99887/m.196183 type:complete len:84 (-) Transcript_99887:87-338(-)
MKHALRFGSHRAKDDAGDMVSCQGGDVRANCKRIRGQKILHLFFGTAGSKMFLSDMWYPIDTQGYRDVILTSIEILARHGSDT